MYSSHWYILRDQFSTVKLPFTVSFLSECEFCGYDVPNGFRVNLSGYAYHPEEEAEELIPVETADISILENLEAEDE